MRRFRVTFSKGEPVRYISHLDLMRTWERILRRAGVKLAHSHGFNPRPKLVFAAPLAVAVTSDAEIVDIVIEDELSPAELVAQLQPSLAPGIEVHAAVEMALDAPAVMASVASSDYIVELASAADLAEPIARFLASSSVPYQRSRKGTTKQSDMRPAVLELVPLPRQRERLGEGPGIRMRLRLDVEGLAVRPEEVVQALDPGWQVRRVHRTGLQLKDEVGSLTRPSPAAAAEDSKLKEEAQHAA
ncbi:MAG TPA: TIGR03936 family radical SAM-associated protein [Chloroflexota bacterium]|jgi:radical SAM-linked protein